VASDTNKTKKTPRQALLGLLLMCVVGGVVGGVVGFLLARSGMALLPVIGSLRALSAWDLLALPVLIVFVLAFHEAGHLAGGMSRGMRFLLFIAGPLGWVRGVDGVRFRWFFNLGTLGGVAAAMPVADQPLKPQLARLIVGGPLASLVLVGLALAVFWWVPGRIGAYGLVIAGLSLLIFLVTAMPMRHGGFMSDGMQLRQLGRDPAMVERRARLLALMGQGLAGVRPRELDPDALANAQAITGHEPLYDIGVWLYSYYRALDAGDVEAAGPWLDQIEPVLDAYPDGFRQAVAVELAMFESLYRHRADVAQAWMARSKGGVVDPSRRSLAQAALALRLGQREAALAALAEAGAKLGRSMDPGASLLSADQLAAIRRELETGSALPHVT
jgi:hypothetical protein